jgi:hypothetical protein
MLPHIHNPGGDFDPLTTEHLILSQYEENLTGAVIKEYVLSRVWWQNSTNSIIAGYRCAGCKILIFAANFADFRHECVK